ncbi:hypothetical protein KUTeg_024099 [Tegillarca granosa]|uniref:FAS1 domain-containing protein n=1 Tax=Tegillarca granosa TaxID=220873 RepID=A0ABQ9E2Q7_TEGGR|nr:hypothetical protein KUTeg_024099 [Tegillarca granosa]
MDPDLLSSVTSDNNALADLLKYHVVSGNYSTADLSVNEMMLTSLAGTKIRVNDYLVKRRITLEGSYITYPNKVASNGIVHRIHDVMLPPKGSIFDIANILKYHVIPGTLYSAGMHSGSLHNLEVEDQERVYASFLGMFGIFEKKKKSWMT